jgi:hypothetical protein
VLGPCHDYDPAVRRKQETLPARPIAPGDIVAAYSEALGEWTAAQVTDLDPAWCKAGVLDLDWSGSEPESVTASATDSDTLFGMTGRSDTYQSRHVRMLL